MYPLYVILAGSLFLPFLFLWEQLFWLLGLYLFTFWLFHLFSFYFIAYSLIIVYVGAIAILIVLSILMMNLQRVWHWQTMIKTSFISLLLGWSASYLWCFPIYYWKQINWFHLISSQKELSLIASWWYNEYPGIVILLAWILLIMTIAIVKSVIYKNK